MKIHFDFARVVGILSLMFFFGVASMRAQNTNPAKIPPTPDLSSGFDEKSEASVFPGEKKNLRSGFRLPQRFPTFKEVSEPHSPFDGCLENWRLALRGSFAPKPGDAKAPALSPEPDRTLAEPPISSRLLSFTFPQNNTAGGKNQPAAPPYVRPTAKERFKGYISNVVGPYSLLGTAAFAGIFQARDLPREWENDSVGYARRFGSALGILAINETSVYALDEAFKLDSNYYKSTKKTIGGRLQDAIVNSFTARKPDGRRVFGFPRIVGNYGSAIVANETWYPKRFGIKDALQDGTYSVGVDVLFNIAREFFWH